MFVTEQANRLSRSRASRDCFQSVARRELAENLDRFHGVVARQRVIEHWAIVGPLILDSETSAVWTDPNANLWQVLTRLVTGRAIWIEVEGVAGRIRHSLILSVPS